VLNCDAQLLPTGTGMVCRFFTDFKVRMSRLIRLWFEICLLRAGPQDLPYSRELLGLAMAGYIMVSFLLSLPAYSTLVAALLALVDSALLVVFAATALYAWGKLARLNQTLTALSGTGMLLGLFALPVLQLLSPDQPAVEPSPLGGLLWLVMFGWNLVVVAHIMRHALSAGFLVAAGIAILYTLLAMQIIDALFPMSAV
jgi:hypothetical protein